MRIVIGDDHALIRDGLRPCLLRLEPDSEVADAGSFAEVLAILSDQPAAALVIVEPKMHDMTPLAGVAAVRAACSGRLALLSSITDQALITAMLGVGANGFIPKRLHLDAVGSALALILAGETFVPSSLVLGDGERAPHHLPGLTPREGEVLALVRDGLSNKGIARRLGLSEVTVKSHLANAFRKLGVQNRVQAVRALEPGFDAAV